MLERPRSWRSASLPQRSRNWNWGRTLLRGSLGHCQKSSESTIFWQRIANSLRNWPPAESSPVKSSRARENPTQATVRLQADSLFPNSPTKKQYSLSFRAERGICFFQFANKKQIPRADRPRNDNLRSSEVAS